MELPDWNPGPPGLYLHIPFCLKKCGYCSFYSVEDLSAMPAILAALSKEMAIYSGKFDRFDTLYIGGGTPSLLDLNDLEKLLLTIDSLFPFTPDREFTVEVNPSDVDPAYFAALRSLGVNRLNIGVQSFDDRILSYLGRRHNSIEAGAAVTAAQEAGFDNIGLDLIYSIPGQDLSVWIDTLNRALTFEVAHLSCYQLTMEKGTPLSDRLKNGGELLPSEGLQRDFFMETSELLESAGYIHYEVSNFARGLHRISRHNRKYWNHSPYLGLGPSAHSFHSGIRWWNHRSVARYIAEIEAGKMPVESSEQLTREQLRLEALFLGLRTSQGIHLADFTFRFQCDLVAEKKEGIEKLSEDGLVTIEQGILRPTRSGLAVADGIASLLYI
jgi:oxygen-independent coproporphyrinogen-3 oxidase